MKIAEVSEKFGLSTYTLRYYEKIGLIPSVKRDASGNREYHDEDLSWLDFITCMRSAGLPIEVLLNYVNLFQQGDKTKDARKNLLIDQRKVLQARIEELQDVLERLNFKIRLYEEPELWNKVNQQREESTPPKSHHSRYNHQKFPRFREENQPDLVE